MIFYNPKLNRMEIVYPEVELYLEVMFMKRNNWHYIGVL